MPKAFPSPYCWFRLIWPCVTLRHITLPKRWSPLTHLLAIHPSCRKEPSLDRRVRLHNLVVILSHFPAAHLFFKGISSRGLQKGEALSQGLVDTCIWPYQAGEERLCLQVGPGGKATGFPLSLASHSSPPWIFLLPTYVRHDGTQQSLNRFLFAA